MVSLLSCLSFLLLLALLACVTVAVSMLLKRGRQGHPWVPNRVVQIQRRRRSNVHLGSLKCDPLPEEPMPWRYIQRREEPHA